MKRTFGRRERLYLAILAGFRCEMCGTPLSPSFHGDHVQPFAKGGPTLLRNGQALCSSCNLTKGARHDGNPSATRMAKESTS